MRTIETAVSTNGMIKPMEGWTNKFIFAPYEFTGGRRHGDQPPPALLHPADDGGGVSAATKPIMNAYKIAKEEGYRFGTYGDAMLIL